MATAIAGLGSFESRSSRWTSRHSGVCHAGQQRPECGRRGLRSPITSSPRRQAGLVAGERDGLRRRRTWSRAWPGPRAGRRRSAGSRACSGPLGKVTSTSRGLAHSSWLGLGGDHRLAVEPDGQARLACRPRAGPSARPARSPACRRRPRSAASPATRAVRSARPSALASSRRQARASALRSAHASRRGRPCRRVEVRLAVGLGERADHVVLADDAHRLAERRQDTRAGRPAPGRSSSGPGPRA